MALDTDKKDVTEEARPPSAPPRPVPSPAPPPVRVPQPPAEKLAGRASRRRAARAAIGVVAAAALALAAASAGGAQAGGELVDPLGDSDDAPDILGVSVSNDAKGELSVMVLFLGGSVVAPPANVQVTLVLDTDKDRATGQDGFDYAFQFDASDNTHGVGRWDGTQFTVIDAPSSAVNWSAISVQFTINRRDLGGTNSFDFWVRSHHGASGSVDDAPNEGVWSYNFAAPKASKVTLATLRPRAGKLLDVRGARLQLTDGSSVAPERLTCRLTAGRAVVKPLRGGCRWRIPQRLKGKTVVLTLVARYGESELRLTRRAVVR